MARISNNHHLIRATVGRSESTIFVSYVPPTAAVKLLQYSGLGSNTGMGFHPTNDSHQCLKMVRLLFGFLDLVKNRGVCWLVVNCNGLK